MVSETEIVNRLREILVTSDLNTTSAGGVRRQLESELGVDLSDRKKFISQQIDLILQSNSNDNGHQQDDDEGNEEDPAADDNDNDNDVVEEEEEEEEEDSNSNKSPKSEEEEENEEEEAPIPKKKRGTGFTRLCSLSPQLQEFLAAPQMARTEVVKRLWAYIREKDLQDPNNRRNIKCDDQLRSIFRVDTINMFQMNKALSKHIWPLERDHHQSTTPPPQKKQKRQKEDDVEKPKQKAQQKGGTSGFLKPLQLSDAFVKFLGTGETTLSRSEAVKRIWQYIKQNDLQDPSDKRRILCDEKLKELFEIDTFNGFSVAKHLTAHLSKLEQ